MLSSRLKLLLVLLFTLALGAVLFLGSLRANSAPGQLEFLQEPPLSALPQPQLAFGTIPSPPSCFPGYESVAVAGNPRQVWRAANPTNCGYRFSQDIFGQPVNNTPIVVLHETVGSGTSAINMFQTRQPDESRQASYHTLILRDGTVVYLVDSRLRAFGAGNSVFVGANGPEAVRTHPKFSASVNNFAYHVSLETPADGRNNRAGHSGYTSAQYQSLAAVVACTQIPRDRISTHRQVDRSGQRTDPRSFNASFFNQLLQQAANNPQTMASCARNPSFALFFQGNS